MAGSLGCVDSRFVLVAQVLMRQTDENIRPETYALFALLCLFWGSTWIAIKIGVTALPPFFFAGTRFLVAGLLLLAWLRLTRRVMPITLRQTLPLVPGAFLMIAVNYGLMAWGMQSVSSGLSAVINLALIPLAMLVFSALYGLEAVRGAKVIGLATGIGGVVMLFYPAIVGAQVSSSVAGMFAIAAGASCYSWGSVVNKRMGVQHSPVVASAVQSFYGGLILTVISVLTEPVDARLWTAVADPAVLASWVFLVVCGSLMAFTIYLVLLGKWNATRVANYAFICPVIALLESAVIDQELITGMQALASALMLGGAWIAMRRPRLAPQCEVKGA